MLEHFLGAERQAQAQAVAMAPPFLDLDPATIPVQPRTLPHHLAAVALPTRGETAAPMVYIDPVRACKVDQGALAVSMSHEFFHALIWREVSMQTQDAVHPDDLTDFEHEAMAVGFEVIAANRPTPNPLREAFLAHIEQVDPHIRREAVRLMAEAARRAEPITQPIAPDPSPVLSMRLVEAALEEGGYHG